MDIYLEKVKVTTLWSLSAFYFDHIALCCSKIRGIYDFLLFESRFLLKFRLSLSRPFGSDHD